MNVLRAAGVVYLDPLVVGKVWAKHRRSRPTQQLGVRTTLRFASLKDKEYSDEFKTRFKKFRWVQKQIEIG